MMPDNSEMVPSHLQFQKFKRELDLANEKIGSLTTQLNMNVRSSMCLHVNYVLSLGYVAHLFCFVFLHCFETVS